LQVIYWYTEKEHETMQKRVETARLSETGMADIGRQNLNNTPEVDSTSTPPLCDQHGTRFDDVQRELVCAYGVVLGLTQVHDSQRLLCTLIDCVCCF
jgi:hypothetical protein